VPALVEEREFQAFCPGALHGVVEPLEKSFSLDSELADHTDHRPQGVIFRLR
jgi:hypothetical protein